MNAADKETARLLGLPDNWRELQTRARPFLVCSGQGRSHRRWGVWCDDPKVLPVWWRLEDDRERVRTFKTHAAALKAAASLTVQGEVMRYAQNRAARIRDYAAAGRDAWEGLHRYKGVSSSLWSADPFGLFTSDIIAPPDYRLDPQWIAKRMGAARAAEIIRFEETGTGKLDFDYSAAQLVAARMICGTGESLKTGSAA